MTDVEEELKDPASIVRRENQNGKKEEEERKQNRRKEKKAQNQNKQRITNQTLQNRGLSKTINRKL